MAVLRAPGPLAHASAVANPLLGRTHMLPSPFTLRAGRLAYGTELAIGVTDFLQVGTNIFRDFFRIFNANAKASLIDTQYFALAATFGFETYNYRNFSGTNPDLRVTSYLPGAVASVALADPLALMVGGTYNLSSTELITEGIATSGYVRGATGEIDLALAYNRLFDGGDGAAPEGGGAKAKAPRKRSSLGNSIAVGVSRDFNYDLWGIGISHHWNGFQLGVHYYPGATKYNVIPIIAGGGSMDL